MRMKNMMNLSGAEKTIQRRGDVFRSFWDITGMMLQGYTFRAVIRMFNSYPDILSVKQLCEILCIGKNTAYRLLQSGEIRSIKIGKVYKIPKKEIYKYLN